MQIDKASRTAYRVAMRRAMHQLVDAPPIFQDPLAVQILGEDEVLLATRDAGYKRQNAGSRSLRAFIAARSRFAEDQLASAYMTGKRQYLILGAGLDTFAYRNPFADLHVFEVDHPATQEMKRHRLQKAGIAIPDNLIFAPVNFEGESLTNGLQRAGFDFSLETFVSCLGVIPYLTLEAITDTLAVVGGMGRGSEMVFDFGLPPGSAGVAERLAFAMLEKRVAAAGEPFRTFFHTKSLVALMQTQGFHRFEVLGPKEINDRYFADRSDGLKVGGTLAHLMHGATALPDG